MAGATAATAAGVTASQANAITINLLNNYISFDSGNNLNADLTGDGHPDLTIANAHAGYPSEYGDYGHRVARVTLNGVKAVAFWDDSGVTFRNFDGNVRLGSRGAHYSAFIGPGGTTLHSYGTHSLTGSIPIFFKDLHINGGAPTEGSLEATVSIGGKVEIQLDSFTYTANTPVAGSRIAAVPDHSSSLALLAMGAGGVLALRRRRTAQETTLNLHNS